MISFQKTFRCLFFDVWKNIPKSLNQMKVTESMDVTENTFSKTVVLRVFLLLPFCWFISFLYPLSLATATFAIKSLGVTSIFMNAKKDEFEIQLRWWHSESHSHKSWLTAVRISTLRCSHKENMRHDSQEVKLTRGITSATIFAITQSFRMEIISEQRILIMLMQSRILCWFTLALTWANLLKMWILFCSPFFSFFLK